MRRQQTSMMGGPLGAVVLGLAAALGGCANVHPETGADAPHADATVAGSGAEAPARVSQREFEGDQLYDLLVGEIAAQRGDIALAIDKYLLVARESRDAGVAERAVRLAMYGRDELRSLEAAKLWSEVAPGDDQPVQVYAALLMRAGRLEEAVEQFEALVVEDDKVEPERFDVVSELLSRERDKKAAMDAMRRVVTGYESNPHALFAFARLAARAGELERAIELLEKLLSVDPDHPLGPIFYARLLQQNGNIQQALRTLAGTLEQRPDSTTVRMTYARLLVDAKHFDEARQQFELLAAEHPENMDVRYALGLLLLQTNHPEAAREQFEHLVQAGDRVEVAHFYLGQIAESLEQDEAALAAYREVGQGEHYLSAQIRVAVILAELGSVDEARSHLQSLSRHNEQEDVRLYRAEAEILSKSDRMEAALGVYDTALEVHAGNPDLLYARAMLAEKLDRLDVVERDLRAILEQEPDNADALNALGYTLADRTDRYEEALGFIARAMELKPDNFYIIDSMGWVLYRIGRYREALEYLRRALELSADPEVAAHLGEVLWVMGEKEEAREVWNTALQTTPDDEHLLEVIRKFSE